MNKKLPVVFSVTSGKGGVGKTNLAVNMAYCLARMNKKVLLLDADLGLANVDVLLGLTPEYNIFHLFKSGLGLDEILVESGYGFKILPASSGITEMLSLSTGQKLELLEAMDHLDESLDFLIVDTGAGINDNVLYFNLAAQERLVVLTPEPTSLTDAYALIKVLNNNHGINRFKIVVNMCRKPEEGREVFKKLYAACDHFLEGISLDLTGIVPLDADIKKAVQSQVPFSSANAGRATIAVKECAQKITNWKPAEKLDGNIKFFWKKFLFQE
ncbi:MAG: MinD/ParA family protein [Thermodesulfobacteriota bacterium]